MKKKYLREGKERNAKKVEIERGQACGRFNSIEQQFFIDSLVNIVGKYPSKFVEPFFYQVGD